jgi:hypothetical protein
MFDTLHAKRRTPRARQAPVLTTLAILGVIYGAGSAGHSGYKMVSASNQKKAYGAGLAEAIRYSKGPENDKDTNNMAMLSFAKA